MGCSTPKSSTSRVENYRELASLEVNFSEQEYILNDCFNIQKNHCYNKHSYDDLSQALFEGDESFQRRKNNVYDLYESCLVDTSVTCAKNNGRDDLALSIKTNSNDRKANGRSLKNMDWFFLSATKIKKFYRFIKNLDQVRMKIRNNAKKFAKKGKKITLKAMHGQGLGMKMSAFAVEGRSLSAEAIILNKEISIFCAPGIVYNTDIGAEIGITKIFAKGCESTADYEGQFLSVGGAVSSESLGLPLSYEGSYSFGFNTLQMKKNLEDKQRDNQYYPRLALSEYYVLKQVLPNEISKMQLTKVQKHALELSTILGMQMLMPSVNSVNFKKILNPKTVQVLYSLYKKSLGSEAKKILSSQSFRNILIKYKLKNLKVFINELVSALSGCDAVSGAISLSGTLSPVSVGVSVTNYSKLISMDLDRLLTFRNISAFAMLNPLLMDTYALSKIVEFAVLIENIPQAVKKKCYNDEYEDIIEAFSLYNNL
jgi:hypothetical protein